MKCGNYSSKLSAVIKNRCRADLACCEARGWCHSGCWPPYLPLTPSAPSTLRSAASPPSTSRRRTGCRRWWRPPGARSPGWRRCRPAPAPNHNTGGAHAHQPKLGGGSGCNYVESGRWVKFWESLKETDTRNTAWKFPFLVLEVYTYFSKVGIWNPRKNILFHKLKILIFICDRPKHYKGRVPKGHNFSGFFFRNPSLIYKTPLFYIGKEKMDWLNFIYWQSEFLWRYLIGHSSSIHCLAESLSHVLG